MNFMMLTHNSTRVKTRRFFVNGTMRKLINSMDIELERLFYADAISIYKRQDYICLAEYHAYVRVF